MEIDKHIGQREVRYRPNSELGGSSFSYFVITTLKVFSQQKITLQRIIRERKYTFEYKITDANGMDKEYIELDIECSSYISCRSISHPLVAISNYL